MTQINRLLKSLVIIFVLCYGTFAQERIWKTFSPNDRAWSVLAPGVMRPDEAALESPSEMGTYAYNDANGYFAVIYRDTPKGRLLWKPMKKSHFNKVRDNFVKENNGQLLKDETFSNGKTEGREIHVKIAEGNFIGSESQVKTKYRVHRIRMFFIDRRFYMIFAVLPETEIDTPLIDKYFNSFAGK